jgi:hypothetical protein
MKYLLVGSVLFMVILVGCEGSKKNDEHKENSETISNTIAHNETDNMNEENIVIDEVLVSEVQITSEEVRTNTNATTQEIELINLFYGEWTNKEQQDISLNLQDGIELLGVKEAQLLSSAEFSIAEVNTEEQSIVIQGYREDISYDEDTMKKEFSSKLYLKNDGKELLYINDFLNEKHESQWMK